MSFDIADNGDFVDGIYNTKAASIVYSMLIGRKTQPMMNKKNDFTEADILFKGYLNKEGSWVKSWKLRYFVLRSDIRELCYYSSKEDMTLIGSIKIDQNTCVWTNKADDDPHFVLSWTPPKNSSEEKREVRLRANDLQTKTAWMEQITLEASRVKDVVLKDWWLDLFGNIMCQRKGDEIEARKKINSVLSGMKKFSILPSSDLHSSVKFLEQAKEGEAGTSTPPVDDMDARAEQLALKVLNKMREKRSTAAITSMSGLFAGMDENVDEELNSEFSGDEPLEDDIDDKHLAKERKKTIVEKIATDDDTDDVDEDFLFSRSMTIVDVKSPTTRDNARQVSKDSDDDTDDEDDEEKEFGKSPTPKEGKHLSGGFVPAPATSTPKQAKPPKVKKEKKLGPPPVTDTHADRFDIDGKLTGLCISVELGHVLVGDEKISCSLSSANLSQSADWKVISHTENYKFENLACNSAANAHRVVHQFQLLQDPAFLKESTHILVILYKASGKLTKGEKKGGNNTPVCSGIVRCDELLSTGGITQVKMTISDGSVTEVTTPNVSKEESSYNTLCLPNDEETSPSSSSSSSSEKQTANLGVVLLSSSEMHNRRMRLTSDMKCRPYAENMYCFRTVQGENLVLEQLYASRYSLTVAKAMLGLIIPERMSILSTTKKIVKNDMKKAISVLKNIPSKAALQELDNMLTGGGEMDDKNTIGTVSRAQSFQKTKNTIKEIRDLMIENYHDCDLHCTQALEGETFPGMVISPDVGGSQLRRSVWKKSPVWQFCTTNLNVHAMTWQSFTDAEVKVQAHIDPSQPRSSPLQAVGGNSDGIGLMSTAASVTFGAPAAHSFGFNDGGLRRLMGGLGSNEETRLKWMCLLQATGGVSMDLLKKSCGDNAKEFKKLFDVHIDMVSGDGWTTVFQKASKLAMRIDACVSQALGYAITAIKTVITLATYGESHQLNCLANAFALKNFLLPVESFLSTQGHEMGMIEDLEAAVLWLSSVQIRLVSSYNHTRSSSRGAFIGMCDDLCICRDPSTGRLVVDLEMNHEEVTMINRVLTMNRQSPSGTGVVSMDDVTLSASGVIVGESDGVILKDSVLAGEPDAEKSPVFSSTESKPLEVLIDFKLTGVLFTCGVNEMQSLVNLSGGKEAHKQNEINLESFERLSNYMLPMITACGSSPSSAKHNKDEDYMVRRSKNLRLHCAELKSTLEAAQATPHVKLPGVLIRSAKICRAISGTVGLLCKSGKDRTSMGVTLEQACVLSESENYILDGQECTRVMRKYGVRRMNVYANTGQGYYAFNGFQQQLLPKCYRPPGGTYGGNVAS